MIRIGRPIRNKSLSVDTNGAINGLVSIQGLWRGNQEGKKCEHVANSRFSKGWLLFSYLGSEENGQVILYLQEICYSGSWNNSLRSMRFVTVNLQWQNGVNLTD